MPSHFSVQYSSSERKIQALLAGEALDSDYDESISKEEQAQINDVLKEIETTAIIV